MQREFKYYPEDFGALTVKVIHMDLLFDVHDEHTKVNAETTFKTLNKPLVELELNAKNLELKELTCSYCDVLFEYNDKEHKIHIHFQKQIPANIEFKIKSETICKPTKHILEGLYYDETPASCPPTQITQCQQWGFQRLAPCIDDMTAKCTYRTTIIADSKYSNIISNGDVAVPRTSIGKGRDSIVYENTKTPMAPYLFFLGVGTYATFKREFEYPDGSTFMLELLAPVTAEKEPAEKALDILYSGIMWIHLFTGAGKYEDVDTKKKILSLIYQREEFKKASNSVALEKIRKEIKELATPLHLGYKYTGTVYREIAMQNSNFGGMENVGNTTVTANRIMPFRHMTDGMFEYLMEVKTHEFYHNLNGSEVTGKSPFELWLNEAVTVHIQEEYLAHMMGKEYARLATVLHLLAPKGGTFDEDSGAKSMPIEPDGFNNPDELITGITYVKAPEFVRMVQQLMGQELFVKGLDLYHKKHKHSNASRADWIQAMEEVSGIDFKRMAEVWLKQTGFPTVNVTIKYDSRAQKYLIHLVQTGFKQGMHWEFPFKVALVDEQGKDIAKKLQRINNIETTIVFDNVKEPAFVSLNREYSFYGKVVRDQVTDQELYLQGQLDPDIVNRYIAFYQLADKEKMKLLKNPNAKVDERFLKLYYSLLSDRTLTEKMGSAMLAIHDAVEDESHAHKYQELYEIRGKLLKAIAKKHQRQLLQLYQECVANEFKGSYVEQEVQHIKNRSVKNLCLGLLARLDTKEAHALIKKQYQTATSATDKMVAFSLHINSKAKDKLKILEKHQQEAIKSLVSWESFLMVVARNESDDALGIIKKIESSPAFRIEQTNDQRALYGAFANNKRKSLLTEEGRAFVKEVLMKLSPINEYTSVGILDVFGKIDYLEEKYQVPIVELLIAVLHSLNEEETPSVYNNIKRLLHHSTKAMSAYEKVHGTIKL